MLSRESFTNVLNWLNDAKEYISANFTPILIGNKIDKTDRSVTFLEASQLSQEQNMIFVETSALNGEGVEEAFLKCARSILTKVENGTIDPLLPSSGVQIRERVPDENIEKQGVCCFS